MHCVHYKHAHTGTHTNNPKKMRNNRCKALVIKEYKREREGMGETIVSSIAPYRLIEKKWFIVCILAVHSRYIFALGFFFNMFVVPSYFAYKCAPTAYCNYIRLRKLLTFSSEYHTYPIKTHSQTQLNENGI